MSDSSADFSALSPELARRVDRVCDRFEAAWRSGKSPRNEDFLEGWSGPERDVLLRELMLLDEECRRAETPAVGEPAEHCASTLPLPGDADKHEPLSFGDYEVLEVIDIGGVGEVYRLRDRGLERNLAIKVLKQKYCDQPEYVRRFLSEARITGRLQHPGVPPVHATGRLPDGRPFFTMRLIRGRTLAEEVAERPAEANSPGSPAALLRLLTLFARVCQTLAFAHAEGVIHRDLKPLNVMVGAFGEVLVLDWGMAKVLDRASSDPEISPEAEALEDTGLEYSVPPQATQPPEDATQPGAVMGTLAYMSPEQARGEVNGLDERTDVFSLGAMLCEVLTGQPPHTGPGGEALLAKAKRPELAEALARLDGCGADAELIGLAKRAWRRTRPPGRGTPARRRWRRTSQGCRNGRGTRNWSGRQPRPGLPHTRNRRGPKAGSCLGRLRQPPSLPLPCARSPCEKLGTPLSIAATTPCVLMWSPKVSSALAKSFAAAFIKSMPPWSPMAGVSPPKSWHRFTG